MLESRQLWRSGAQGVAGVRRAFGVRTNSIDEVAMTHRTPLPGQFGRVTAIAEHARIDHAMTALRGLGECIRLGDESATGAARLRERFDDLLEMLARHFAGEESPAYFGALASERPGTCATIAVLCAEHSEMLELVRALRALSADPHHLHELPDKIMLLVERLRTHERLETLLMQDYLLADE
jgi:hypothetical protein